MEMKEITNKNIRKIFCVTLSVILAAAMLCAAGCSFKIPAEQGSTIHNGSDDKPGTVTNTFGDGVIGERKEGKSGKTFFEGIIDSLIPGRKSLSGKAEMEAYPAEDAYGPIGDYPVPLPGGDVIGSYDDQIQAGLLTAGEIKDIKDVANWISLWNEADWAALRRSRGLYADNIITASVLPFSAVELLDGDSVVYRAVSDIYGNATLIFPDSLAGKELTVKSGEQSATVTCKRGESVSLTQNVRFAPQNAKSLDLMLMIDTTGSMGDELEYLKVEIRDMINRIRAEQDISIRLSVNFYRDEGDDYIVKYYDFRDDIDDCVKILGEQSANGGGDYPEAVHTALGNVLQHSWRDDSVKLCFFVLDAPPHEESEIQGINAGMLKDVTAIAAKGVRIIPVVSSGADLSVEALMRGFSVMTGGTYLFLTNHSGIGGDHQTPTDTQYEVEPLNDCMVRVIKEYVFVKS
jgi:hypothetical protein